MSNVAYPTHWPDSGSEGLVINYSELTALCAANNLDSGHIAYIAEQMRMICMGTINQILELKEP